MHSNSRQYSHLQKLLALDSQRCLQRDQRCVRSRAAAKTRICLVNQALLQAQKAALWALEGILSSPLARNTASIRKNTRLQIHMIKRSRKRYATARKAASVQPKTEAVLDFHGQYNSWFSMPSMQATTTHFWLQSVTLQLEAVPVCSSPALIPVFELWKIHFLFAHAVERKKAVYTHV